MTQCMGAPSEQWLEPYLAGTLEDAQAQAFEEHYFDCPVCLAQVQAMQAVAQQLRLNPVSLPARKILAWPVHWRTLAAAAALLAAVWVGYRWENSKPPSSNNVAKQVQHPASPAEPAKPDLTEIADLSLPPYRASSLRGDEEDAHFRTGMKAYASGDCSKALPRLAQVPARSPDTLAARFYEGACQMQLKQWDQAVAALQGVASKGESPQQEGAMYMLAQIALARGDLDSARRQLEQITTLHGDFEQRAQRQLGELGSAPR